MYIIFQTNVIEASADMKVEGAREWHFTSAENETKGPFNFEEVKKDTKCLFTASL